MLHIHNVLKEEEIKQRTRVNQTEGEKQRARGRKAKKRENL